MPDPINVETQFVGELDRRLAEEREAAAETTPESLAPEAQQRQEGDAARTEVLASPTRSRAHKPADDDEREETRP